MEVAFGGSSLGVPHLLWLYCLASEWCRKLVQFGAPWAVVGVLSQPTQLSVPHGDTSELSAELAAREIKIYLWIS